MKAFFLNLTYILEKNPKIYWSVIVGIVLCSMLYVIEVVHIQNMLAALESQDKEVIRNTIDPIAQAYTWARIATFIVAMLCAIFYFFKTKKLLNL